MNGYIIFIRERTLDEQQLRIYKDQLTTSLKIGDARILSLDRAHDELEGEQAEAIMLLEFNSVSAARAWYESEGYASLRKHRWRGADYRVILLQGEPT